MSLVKSIGGKKVNFDFNKDFISIFSDKIKSRDLKFINQTLKDLHPSDVANLIENISPDIRSKLIEIDEFNIDPEIFIELNESVQSEVLQLLSTDYKFASAFIILVIVLIVRPTGIFRGKTL